MAKLICATVLLQRPDGSFLMQLRDDGRGTAIPFPNMWNFPGGAAAPQEAPLEAAIREVAEEFEIILDPNECKEIWKYAHDHAASDHIFFCKVPADVKVILREGAACAWMTLSEITQLNLGFDQSRIVAQLLGAPATVLRPC
jgi:8-oxo-dGTP pyrophosphatase MutT (NUDIX family)